jgi:hypothetical protein
VWSRRPGGRFTLSEVRQNHLLDIPESVFAEKDLVIDKEGWRAEGAALDGALRVIEQLRSDLGILNQLAEALGIETRFNQGSTQYSWIV